MKMMRKVVVPRQEGRREVPGRSTWRPNPTQWSCGSSSRHRHRSEVVVDLIRGGGIPQNQAAVAGLSSSLTVPWEQSRSSNGAGLTRSEQQREREDILALLRTPYGLQRKRGKDIGELKREELLLFDSSTGLRGQKRE
jgi:hypothetical protein